MSTRMDQRAWLLKGRMANSFIIKRIREGEGVGFRDSGGLGTCDMLRSRTKVHPSAFSVTTCNSQVLPYIHLGTPTL